MPVHTSGSTKADVDTQLHPDFPLVVRGSIAVEIALKLGVAADLEACLLFEQPFERIGVSLSSCWFEQLTFDIELETRVGCIVPFCLPRLISRCQAVEREVAQPGQLLLQGMRDGRWLGVAERDVAGEGGGSLCGAQQQGAGACNTPL